MRALVVVAAEVEVHLAQNDGQVFLDLGKLLLGRRGLQLGDQCFVFFALGVFVGQRRLRGLDVILRQPLLRAELGVVLERDVEQHLGVAVADRDPVRLRRRAGLRSRGVFRGLVLGRHGECK